MVHFVCSCARVQASYVTDQEENRRLTTVTGGLFSVQSSSCVSKTNVQNSKMEENRSKDFEQAVPALVQTSWKTARGKRKERGVAHLEDLRESWH